MPIINADAELKLTAGPFIGQNDTPSLGAQDAQRFRKAINMYSPAAAVNGDLISRPRFTRVDFSATACSGTINISSSPTGTLTGTSTHFTTELSVGDLITTNGVTAIVATISSDTAGTVRGATGAPAGSAAYTVTPAGIVGGQVLGCWQHTLSTGVYHRFFLVTTTSASVDGSGAGGFRFLTAGSVAVRLVEWDPTKTGFQRLVDRTTTSMNSVALGAANRIYATSFANYFIVSDGVQRPRKIDSSFVLTNLTDANYAFFGPLTIYYGALFAIDASDQITMRWSEPNAPDTGYGTGTSDLSWSLQQTSADPLQCLIGTNQALFAFRSNSVAIITGAANSDFASSGAVDAVQSIGSRSPDSVLLAGASVTFMDQYMRPGRIQLGYGYIPLWPRIQETLRGIGKTVALESNAWGRLDPTTNLIKFGYRGTSTSTQNEQMLVFDAQSFECLGTHVVPADTNRTPIDHGFSAGNPQSTSPMLDANLLPIHVVASGITGDLAFYWQDHEDVPSSVAQDLVAGGTAVTVQGTVTPPLLGGDPLLEKTWERVVVGTRFVGGTSAGLATIKMQYRNPYFDYTSAAAMTYSGTNNPSPTQYDGMTVKVEAKGLKAQASRYLDCSFQNDVTGNPATRFTFDTVTVVAHPKDDQSSRR